MTEAGQREHLAALFEAAAGPLTWLDHDTASGSIRGYSLTLATHTANIAGGNRVITGGKVSVDLGGRPLRMLIDNRARTHPALPVVVTGDAAFDDLFLIQGWPDQALRMAFDDDVRRWITGQWPNGWPALTAEGGRLVGRLTVFRHGGSDDVMSAEDFRRATEGIVALAERLVSAHDAERASAVAHGGAGAGAAWDESLRANETNLAGKRVALRAIVFGGFALACALILLAVAAASGIL